MRVILLCLGLFSGWREGGVPVVEKPGAQVIEDVEPYIDGGVAVLWRDSEERDLYVQVLDSLGNRVFEEGGIVVARTEGSDFEGDMVVDSLGNLIVVWVNCTYNGGEEYDIYANKISRDGERVWGDEGVGVCVGIEGDQRRPHLCISGDGVYVVWEDYRWSNEIHLVGQRIDWNGNVKWEKEGKLISLTLTAGNPILVPDNEGNVYVYWRSNVNLCALIQKIDTLGNLLFGDSGIYIYRDKYGFIYEGIPDGDDGVILNYVNYTVGGSEKDSLWIERRDRDGGLVWRKDVSRYSAGNYECYESHILKDERDGIYITWDYVMQGWYGYYNECYLYGQRMDMDGGFGWQVGGKKLISFEGPDSTNLNGDCYLGSDLEGGIIIGYSFSESWVPDVGFKVREERENSIEAMRVNKDGEVIWRVVVSDYPCFQRLRGMVSDGRGHYILVWEDDRAGDRDIYCAMIDTAGHVVGVREKDGGKRRVISRVMVGKGVVRIDLSSFSFPVSIVRIYDCSGRVVYEERLSGFCNSFKWDGRDRSGRRVNEGIYFIYLFDLSMDNLERIKVVYLK